MENKKLPYRLFFISILACIAGVVATGTAALLIRLIGLLLNLLFHGRYAWTYVEAYVAHLSWWSYLIPVLGAALAGILIKYGSVQIKGHGIPEAMEAVLYRESRIPLRVALLKPLSAAITIGSGGPFGAEGPIIQTGGAVGSLVGQVIPVSAQERKILLACGAAAGTVAIFNTTIAAVFLTTELLLFEFSAISLIPVIIASATAYFFRGLVFGADPAFLVPTAHIGMESFPWLIVFGVIAGLSAAALTKTLYFFEDLMEAIPKLDNMTRPIFGAVLFAPLAVLEPRILGVGYGNIKEILFGNLPLSTLLSLFFFKGLGWLVALGSGTSGGVLAPLFIISGSLGGILGHFLYPFTHIPGGIVALLMMAAMFGAGTHARLSAAIFAAELTRDFQMLVPLILVTAVAEAVALRLLPYSIMTGKLVRRGVQVPNKFICVLEKSPDACLADGEEHKIRVGD